MSIHEQESLFGSDAGSSYTHFPTGPGWKGRTPEEQAAHDAPKAELEPGVEIDIGPREKEDDAWESLGGQKK